MGKPTGFKEFTRELPTKRDPKERVNDYKELYNEFSEEKINHQAARCMDCGVPFCHSGCPLGNIIPEFNDAVYQKDWELAYEILSSTNNFPEFTGRICPAPCESACVLGINQPPVAIEEIEKNIAENAYNKGFVKPRTNIERTGKKVAVIGSGPAGLAASDQLNKAGHEVTLFERADAIGGLLRYGIPDFKLEKWVIDRRTEIMAQEGVTFTTNAHVGVNVKTEDLLRDFDAVVLTGGSTVPRDIPIAGRNLKGIYPAMEFLSQQNKRNAGLEVNLDHTGRAYKNGDILAAGKNIVVIGGGDTGADCVGTSNRHKAASVTQIEINVKPPVERSAMTPWPQWPMMLRTSTSHDEGCVREWAINTKEFVGDENGNLKALKIVEVEFEKEYLLGQRPQLVEIAGTERLIPCELALIAAGFLNPEKEGLLSDLGVDLDERGNVVANNYQTSAPKVFVAGDMRRGQSLVVWAIAEGREAARAVDTFLTGSSKLEARDLGILDSVNA